MTNKAVRYVTTTKKPKQEPMSVLIVAAGVSPKMRSYGTKSLLKYENTTVLGLQTNIIWQKFNKADILGVVGFEADRVMNSVKSIRFVENAVFEETNVVKSLGLGLRAMTERAVLIIYGDILFNVDAIHFNTNESSVFFSQGMLPNSGPGVIITDSYATHLGYGLNNQWNKMIFLRDKELDLFKDYVFDSENNKMLGHDAINYVLDNGGNIRAINPKNTLVYEINNYKDVAKGFKAINENSINL